MEFSVRDEKGVCVIQIDGRIDSNTSPELDAAVSKTLSETTANVIVDMSRIDYMSSSGLRVFLAGAKKLKTEKRELVFIGVKGPILKVFKFAGFHMLFKMFDTEEAALEHLSK